MSIMGVISIDSWDSASCGLSNIAANPQEAAAATSTAGLDASAISSLRES